MLLQRNLLESTPFRQGNVSIKAMYITLLNLSILSYTGTNACSIDHKDGRLPAVHIIIITNYFVLVMFLKSLECATRCASKF